MGDWVHAGVRAVRSRHIVVLEVLEVPINPGQGNSMACSLASVSLFAAGAQFGRMPSVPLSWQLDGADVVDNTCLRLAVLRKGTARLQDQAEQDVCNEPHHVHPSSQPSRTREACPCHAKTAE